MARLLESVDPLIEAGAVKRVFGAVSHNSLVALEDGGASSLQLVAVSCRPKHALIVVAVFLGRFFVWPIQPHLHRSCGVRHRQLEKFARDYAALSKAANSGKVAPEPGPIRRITVQTSADRQNRLSPSRALFETLEL